jgi:hypothetical protein
VGCGYPGSVSQAIIPVKKIIATIGGQDVELSPQEFVALYSAGLLSFENGSRPRPPRANRRAVQTASRGRRAVKKASPVKKARPARKAAKRIGGFPAGYWNAAKTWGSANGFAVSGRGRPSRALLDDYYKSSERKRAFPEFEG